MKLKKIIPAAVLSQCEIHRAAARFDAHGADEILIWDNRYKMPAREEDLIGKLSTLTGMIDIPLMVYQVYDRFEDIKKIIYAGASKAVMNPFEGGKCETLKEGIARFGADHVIGTLMGLPTDSLPGETAFKAMVEETGCHVWLLELCSFNALLPVIISCGLEVILCSKEDDCQLPVDSSKESLLAFPSVDGITWMNISENGEAISYQGTPENDFIKIKETLKSMGQNVNMFESALDFSEFKLNSDGLIPVVTQDYKSGKVLMVAYMNEESYKETIRSGKMTYYSRSRQCLWKKGDTSGHYQYIKSLDIDCDCDTILAKVRQIGAACHTGNESCFFTNLVKKEYDDTNPSTILQEIMSTVADRKAHPKEGSYTNYLFDKGIDKILKKVGEEATEIVIAAKNPDASELKYEISDFLYHMIVLMVERGVSWEEISSELAKRH